MNQLRKAECRGPPIEPRSVPINHAAAETPGYKPPTSVEAELNGRRRDAKHSCKPGSSYIVRWEFEFRERSSVPIRLVVSAPGTQTATTTKEVRDCRRSQVRRIGRYADHKWPNRPPSYRRTGIAASLVTRDVHEQVV